MMPGIGANDAISKYRTFGADMFMGVGQCSQAEAVQLVLGTLYALMFSVKDVLDSNYGGHNGSQSSPFSLDHYGSMTQRDVYLISNIITLFIHSFL